LPTAQSHVAAERTGASFLPRKDANASNSANFWLSIAGVALAGAACCSYKREVQVSVGVSNRQRLGGAFADIYGPQGETAAPDWLMKSAEDPGTEKPKDAPPWLTLDKWETLAKEDQRRDFWWWKRVFDSTGKKLKPERTETHTISEAVDILMDMITRSPGEIDETVEIQMSMNLDSKFPDQQIRTSLNLPHGTGKSKRVAVFSLPGEDEELENLGAAKYGALLEKEIGEGVCDFDVLIAKPQAMPKLAKLGKILGPKRLMPSPKSGTVVTDYAKAIEEFQGGLIELRNEKWSLVMCGVGKVSFGKEKIIENFKAVLQGLADKKPAGAQKKFWNKVWIKTTHNPALQIDPSEFPKIELEEDDSDDEDDW